MNTADIETTPENRAKADASRARAAEAAQRSQESWDRSDTDGFLSQWANNSISRKESLQAQIDEQNGLWEHPALFDLEGNMLAATPHKSKYGGTVWRVLEGDEPNSEVKEWFNESGAKSAKTRIVNNAKKGYYVGTVLVPSYAATGGSGRGLSGLHTVYNYVARDDRGFSRKNTIVDNGQDKLREAGLRG